MSNHYAVNTEYVHNNCYKAEFEEDGNPNKKGLHLMADGFLMKKQRATKDGQNWRCKVGKCPASITLNKNGEVTYYVKHVVTDEHQPLSELDLQVKDFQDKCKVRASNEDTPTNQIYLEELNGLALSSQASSEELANNKFMKSFQSLKPTLEKRRRNNRPKLPTSLKTVILTGEYTKTTKGDKYLILNTKNNKILVFTSPDGLKCLSKCERWAGDGTFHVASKYYYQLYIIHGYFMNRMIPCVYALMNRRRASDYVKVFKIIKKEAKIEHDLDLNPKIIMTDFEKAAIKAFKEVFESEIKGCLFHFGQSLFKNLVRFGFKEKYSNDETVRQWFKSIFILALTPMECVDDVWQTILEKQVPGSDPFLSYFVKTYFEDSFPIMIWNLFLLTGPRTNNSLEGYNHKLKNHIGVADPNIFKAVLKFKEEEVNATNNYYMAIKGEPVPTRRKCDIGKDDLLASYKKMYNDGDISINVYLKYITPLYELDVKKKKKSNEEEDKSDSEDDSGSDSDDE